jgi:glycosyltransferase involved in cell wall biosynthesis
MTNPLISVLVPSFNQGAYIGDMIESVLSQNYRPIELIIMDGVSTDNTLEVLSSYKYVKELYWRSEPDNGPVDALNKALNYASGEIGLIQSTDDLSCPGAFEAVAEIFKTSSDLGLVYGNYERVDANGHVISRYETGKYSLSRLLSRQTFVPQPAGFFWISLAKELHGWDQRFPYCPDTELWFKIALKAKVKHLDVVLGQTRTHTEQRDHQTSNILKSYKRMVIESDYMTQAPWYLRRAALAGYHQAMLRYSSTSDWILTKNLWRAVVLWPPLILSHAIPKHRLIPGYFCTAGIIGSIKRLLKKYCLR